MDRPELSEEDDEEKQEITLEVQDGSIGQSLEFKGEN
jgi:hypothetical protein